MSWPLGKGCGVGSPFRHVTSDFQGIVKSKMNSVWDISGYQESPRLKESVSFG